MPQAPLDDYDLKVLDLADRAKRGILYRGRFGWPSGSLIPSYKIRGLVEHGYAQFIYDWDKDKPAIRLTVLGKSKLDEQRTRNYYIPDKLYV
jgi:hypothetical protein